MLRVSTLPEEGGQRKEIIPIPCREEERPQGRNETGKGEGHGGFRRAVAGQGRQGPEVAAR